MQSLKFYSSLEERHFSKAVLCPETMTKMMPLLLSSMRHSSEQVRYPKMIGGNSRLNGHCQLLLSCMLTFEMSWRSAEFIQVKRSRYAFMGKERQGLKCGLSAIQI